MAKRVGVDKWMFGSTLLLVVLGVLMVFSASAVMASEKFGSPYHFLFRQLMIRTALAALVALVRVFDLDHIRAEQRELIGRERTGQHMGYIDDLDAFEWSHNLSFKNN